MLHQQFRAAREAANLTQTQLARKAGIPRSQLQKLEDGRNVTLETLMKVAAQLPNLGVVTAGPLHLQFTADADYLRTALIELIGRAQRIVELLDRGPIAVPAQLPAAGQSDLEVARKLDPIAEEAIALDRATRNRKDVS